MIEDSFTNLGIILRAVTVLIMVIGLLPIMYKESRVTDGLTFLRYAIFSLTITYVLMNTLFLAVSIGRAMDLIGDEFLPWVSSLGSISNLIISGIIYVVYRRKYKEPFL